MTLGPVGRASYAEFAGKRKLLLVPYVTPTREDQELHDLIGQYWEEALGQVKKLEVSLGEVLHLFHEGSVGEGKEALEVIELGNPAGYPHLKLMIDGGAALEPTEDVESLKETLDLHRCMSVVQASRSVIERLAEWFEESRRNRYLAIAKNVDERMSENEVGMLVISPDHEVKFAADIEVVYVAPPALDRINRWMSDHPMSDRPSQSAEVPEEGSDEDGEMPGGAKADS